MVSSGVKSYVEVPSQLEVIADPSVIEKFPAIRRPSAVVASSDAAKVSRISASTLSEPRLWYKFDVRARGLPPKDGVHSLMVLSECVIVS